jgi:preprotein translocase subunit YajC
MSGAAADDSAGLLNLVFLGLIFVVFYFFIIRPQNVRQKEIQKKVSEIKKGDKIITSGGLVLIVSQIEDDSVLAETGGSSKLRILKTAITDVNPNKTTDTKK